MDDRRWMAPIDTDAYHGQIRSRDGQSFWVFPRLHRASGWFVEIRADAPDGDLLGRSWHPTYGAAGHEVRHRREELAHLTADEVLAIPRPTDGLRDDLALVVAHGPRLGNRGYTPEAAIDGAVGFVCQLAWVPAGTTRVEWTSVFSRFPDPVCWTEVVADAGQVHHLSKPSHLRPRRPRPVRPWHRCALRSLQFVDGQVSADRDVRQLLSRR